MLFSFNLLCYPMVIIKAIQCSIYNQVKKTDQWNYIIPLGSMQRKSSTQIATGWRKNKIFSSAPQCSEGEWSKKNVLCLHYDPWASACAEWSPTAWSAGSWGHGAVWPWSWGGDGRTDMAVGGEVARLSGYSLKTFGKLTDICLSKYRKETRKKRRSKRKESG